WPSHVESTRPEREVSDVDKVCVRDRDGGGDRGQMAGAVLRAGARRVDQPDHPAGGEAAGQSQSESRLDRPRARPGTLRLLGRNHAGRARRGARRAGAVGQADRGSRVTAPILRVVHRTAARTRLRTRGMKGNSDYFAQLRSAFLGMPGVRAVQVNPLTESVLVTHEVPIDPLLREAEQRGFLRLDLGPAE